MANHYTNKKSHHRHGTEDNHSITRDSIISTAFDLFREKGYAKASMSELARRVDMDPSSVYYYFPQKKRFLQKFQNLTLLFPRWKNCLHITKVVSFSSTLLS